MDIRFVVERGAQQRHVFRMVGREMVVGRQTGCGIRVPSAEVSRQHCRLTVAEGLLWVQDLDSANGTFLNEQAVDGREVVRPGDRLLVGPVTFVVEYELDQAALKRMARQSRSQKPAKAAEPRTMELFNFLNAPDEEGDEADSLEVLEPDSDSALPVLEDEPSEAEVEVELDAPLDLPAEEQLRDFLSQLQDGESE